MYVEAIEKASQFTRPIHIISRKYGQQAIIPSAATLFFVNDNGCALTCKHVLDIIANADKINSKYKSFLKKRSGLEKGNDYRVNLKILEKEFGYNKDTTIQVKATFVDCVDVFRSLRWHIHPQYDLAVIIFDDFQKILYKSHATFLKDSSQIKQGRNLCRLGYPFPEFTNYNYNKQAGNIEWTQKGKRGTPKFPIDGIVTRLLVDNNEIFGIEMSTPGLRDQSGGPLFDESGLICGMQYSTNHLHLGFDLVNHEIVSDGKRIEVNNQPFLHVGHCIHVDIIKDFLKQHKIDFFEE